MSKRQVFDKVVYARSKDDQIKHWKTLFGDYNEENVSQLLFFHLKLFIFGYYVFK